MIRHLFFTLMCTLAVQGFPQQGQLGIARIDRMPDSPSPLFIRDWKAVTKGYDSLAFNLNLTGQHLPLVRLGTPGQFNYEGNIPIFLDSYVGADDHANQAEAINILPAIVGASLVGIDKSNQGGRNWVSMAKDFFNLRNGQNVYLNNYSTTSGSDWWYDVMPNIFFYQLRSLYPDAAPEFEAQFVTVADRWLKCINQLGGGTTPWTLPQMNYRAFNLATGLPLTLGVPEPESAGSIAWLLYNAWLETGNKQYFSGAQLAMDFLSGLQSNPSYELQLPYGTLTAARMNAMEGTDYPIEKLLDWCFNRGDLRGWGSIVGNWGGYDVSGLIGEANNGGDDYAFVMNGFQQAAALAPLPKYDKRYARAIAKWLLNVTNASRLFYWNALPASNQDSYSWATEHDPDACIPHESMKEVWGGHTPFATGDAIRGGWAATNLSLYSGSSVGYLAAVVQPTDVHGILQIDLNRTDFYGDNTLAAYLYYNPDAESRQIGMDLPTGSYGVYDAITEAILFPSASESVNIEVPAGEVRLIRLYPAGLVPEVRDGRLYAGNDILDYHYQYDYTASIRIKSLSARPNPVLIHSTIMAYCEPGNTNPGDTIQFEWFLDDVPVEGKTQSAVQITAPGTPSQTVLKCRVSIHGRSAEDTLHIEVVERIPVPPVVNGIQSGSTFTVKGGSNTFTALVEPAADEILEYDWSASIGTLSGAVGNAVTWQAPPATTVATITVKVTNQDMLSTTLSTPALIKDTTLPEKTPLIWYPLDSDEQNAVADRFHATAIGVTKTDDPRGQTEMARRFTSGTNIIYTENAAELNFTGAVSLSCWIRCEQLGSERFILSHGSWQERYKLSIIPEGFLRWTIKTNTGVCDLDSSVPIELNRWYHVTALYTGYSMELYIDGMLDTFRPFAGNILTTTKPFTIGRMDNVETLYALRGSVDEVKIWDTEIPVRQIEQLRNQWALPVIDTIGDPITNLYPNPAAGSVTIEFSGNVSEAEIALFSTDGKKVKTYQVIMAISGITLEIPELPDGLYLLRLTLKDNRTVSRKIMIRQSNSPA
jgi:hypothetical protein